MLAECLNNKNTFMGMLHMEARQQPVRDNLGFCTKSGRYMP